MLGFLATLSTRRAAASFGVHCSFRRSGSERQSLVRTSLRIGQDMYDSSDSESYSTSSSLDFAMSPDTEEARTITTRLGLSQDQHDMLAELSSLVVEWNEKINLVSRRDCTTSVVFGRHVLPSVALVSLDHFETPSNVIDVGTGGGFPGLPLAIARPETNFMLVDSVGKKIMAVEAMTSELGLTNVQTHHGRAEELVEDALEGHMHKGAYDVCVGRSVAALPKFCSWVSDLIKTGGKLIYIMGGETGGDVLDKVHNDVPISNLLGFDDASDKRVLVFNHGNVSQMAQLSGEKKQKRGASKRRSNPRRARRQAKGEWSRRDASLPKQRGYDDFQRYDA